jgi:hypothetical protein
MTGAETGFLKAFDVVRKRISARVRSDQGEKRSKPLFDNSGL